MKDSKSEYSVIFEDEHGGEGKILFNPKTVAAVVISPPGGSPEQAAEITPQAPERELARHSDEARGVARKDSDAKSDVGTTQEPFPQKEPPADPI